MRLPSVSLVILLLGSAPLARAQVEAVPAPTAPGRSLVVAGTDRNLGETPITVEIPAGTIPPGRCKLVDPTTKSATAAVVYTDGDRLSLGCVLAGVAAGTTIRYAIEPDATPDRSRGVELTTTGRRVRVQLDGTPWTNYIPDDGPKPYFDPLIGPAGSSLTRSWPMREVAGEPHDHPHHRSLWFAHFDTNKADTWDEMPGHGQIRESAPPILLGGGPVAVLRTTDDWLDRAGAKVCEDARIVRFYATRDARVFDFEVTLKATSGPLRIGDNKDGVFAVRVAATMAVIARLGGRIVNSRGLRDTAAWGQPAEWVDYAGPVEGKTMGIALLNQPTSFRFPTTWHVRDYGLFAANPFGWHDFGQAQSGTHTIPPGDSIHLAYRVILHPGTTEEARIEAQFQGYAHPPGVTLR